MALSDSPRMSASPSVSLGKASAPRWNPHWPARHAPRCRPAVHAKAAKRPVRVTLVPASALKKSAIGRLSAASCAAFLWMR